MKAMPKRKLLFFYTSKVSLGCFAAYLAILAIPILGLSPSAETEQVVSALAAITGSDFIGFLIRRVFGEYFQTCKDDYNRKKEEEAYDESDNI